MAKIIGLPKLSPTMEEGTLVRWVKNEGDAIEVDDLIAEVETDKATMEFRSFDKGVLLKQLALEGATLQPDQPVAIIGKQGEDIAALLEKAGGGAPSETAPRSEPKVTAQAAPGAGKADAKAGQPEPAGDVEHGEQPVEAVDSEAAAPEQEPNKPAGRVLASPVVRKIARENDIDLSGVEGSGPHGRVIKRDVEGAGSRVGLPGSPLRGPSAPAPAPKKQAPPAAKVAVLPAPAPTVATQQGDRTEKLSQMRKTIARRLVESKRDVPHFYLTIDIDAAPLVSLRELLNKKLAASGEKISLNDLMIKACAVALRRMPRVNVSYAGDSMIWHQDVNISVAVAVPDGLVTPVLRNADRLGVLEIAQQRARSFRGAPGRRS